jgi:hypothetical protein
MQIDVPQFLRDLAARAPGPAEIVSVADGRYPDLRLDLTRPGESEPCAWILVSASLEVFFLNLTGGYQIVQTAYTLEDQIEVLQDLFDIGCSFLDGDSTEHLWERDGHVIFRELRFTDSPAGALTHGGLKGRLVRRFGRRIEYHQRAGEQGHCVVG